MAKKIIFAIAFTAIIFIWAFGSSPQSLIGKYLNQPRWTVGERLIYSGATLIWTAGLTFLFKDD